MITDILNRIRNAPALLGMRARQTFIPAGQVSLKLPRTDEDWASRVEEMCAYCEASWPGRWRFAAPLSSDVVTFSFASSTDATFFKLRFG
jgi:hypothetical protein